MEELIQNNEINQANIKKYYPFVPQINTNKIFFSHRYFTLIEEYLEDKEINVTIYDREEKSDKKILPEYNEYELCCIEATHEILEIKYDKIYVLSCVNNITIDTLYKTLCSSYHAHNWYREIENFTFNSVLIDLNNSEIQDIFNNNTNAELHNKITNSVTLLNSKNGVFVRLYSLSPKSSVKCYNSKQVIELISSSARTIWSLHNYEKNGIMLREYVDMNNAYEFRLFVFGSVLRAISQYFCYVYFEELEDNQKRQHIYNNIVSWFATIYKNISYEDYTVDILVSTNDIKIIEINSFGPGLLSGSSLFSWTKDYDILHFSKKPVIRFVDCDVTL
mgnify:CR=1 FL=1